MATLIDFRFKKTFAAESGKPGSTSNKSGRSAEDLVIPLPVGTLVYRIDPENRTFLLADLVEEGQRVRVAKGGRGGLGNQHFATSARQAPRFAGKGEPPETCTLRLELKLLADCGLVGLPNAGKSTLLSVVSAARPKIADYPFTTLEPQLGVVRLMEEASFVMVDIPGLIEGAHEGAGLGHRFLRHIERTRVLIHLLDGTQGIDEILAGKQTIERELAAWSPKLQERHTIPVITKLDVPEARAAFEELKTHIPGLQGISAATNENVRALLFEAYQAIQQAPPRVIESDTPYFVLTPDEAFEVTIDERGTYVLSGKRVEHLAAMTDFDSDESLFHFEQILAKIGVEKRLQELGIKEGDTVRIADWEFNYS